MTGGALRKAAPDCSGAAWTLTLDGRLARVARVKIVGGPDIVEQFGDFEFRSGFGLCGQFLD